MNFLIKNLSGSWYSWWAIQKEIKEAEEFYFLVAAQLREMLVHLQSDSKYKKSLANRLGSGSLSLEC